MTEPTSGRGDVALFRAVHTMPFAKLKDIMCAHYGAKHCDEAGARHARQGFVGGNNNLYLYLIVTNRLGRNDRVVAEIMKVYNNDTQQESASVEETAASQQPPGDTVEPSVFDKTTVEAGGSVMALDEDVSDVLYTEAFECNTTRSYMLEIGDVDSDRGQDSDDNDCEEESGCSDQDQDRCSESVQRDVAEDQGILEDETVENERPKAVVEDE